MIDRESQELHDNHNFVNAYQSLAARECHCL